MSAPDGRGARCAWGYPAGPLAADAGEAAFHAKALQRFDALAQARDVALSPCVSIPWSRRFGLHQSLLLA
ncbi:hypothetical protein [Xanthomonas campestris]|uniref:hypothetical protein n=1 Tax=Xanthomonas campestris TaxID=339 RepID=UPI003CF7B379